MWNSLVAMATARTQDIEMKWTSWYGGEEISRDSCFCTQRVSALFRQNKKLMDFKGRSESLPRLCLVTKKLLLLLKCDGYATCPFQARNIFIPRPFSRDDSARKVWKMRLVPLLRLTNTGTDIIRAEECSGILLHFIQRLEPHSFWPFNILNKEFEIV